MKIKIIKNAEWAAETRAYLDVKNGERTRIDRDNNGAYSSVELAYMEEFERQSQRKHKSTLQGISFLRFTGHF